MKSESESDNYRNGMAMHKLPPYYCVLILLFIGESNALPTHLETSLYSSTSITYGYISGDVNQIAGPFLVKQDTDSSSQQFAALTSTLSMVATYPIGPYAPEFHFTFDFWYPHDKQLLDDLLPHNIRLLKAYIRLPLTETSSILLGKDKLPLGWQDPSEIQEAGLPLLSGSGNLYAYYPQLRIESSYKQYFWQLYFIQINGKYHNAEEYLEGERQWGWTNLGSTAFGSRLVMNITSRSCLGFAFQKGYIEVKEIPGLLHDSFVYLFEWNLIIGQYTIKGDIFRAESDQMFLGGSGYLSDTVEYAGYGGWSEISRKRGDKLLLKTGFGCDFIKNIDLLKSEDYKWSEAAYLGFDYCLAKKLTISSMLRREHINAGFVVVLALVLIP